MVAVETPAPSEAPGSSEMPTEPESTWRGWAIYLLVVLALVAAGVVGWWLGSNDDNSAESVDIAQQWSEAFVSGDPDAVADLYADDGVMVNYWVIEDAADFNVESWAEPTFWFEGRNNVRVAASSWMFRNTLDSVRYESVITSDYLVVAEMIWTGVHKSVVAEDTSFSEPLVVAFEFDDDGMITRSILMYRDDLE